MNQQTVQVDARGLSCPIPVLRAKKTLNGMSSGEVMALLSSDPGSEKDLSAFCQQTGNEFISCEPHDGAFLIHVRKS